jgi:hypothetical protein
MNLRTFIKAALLLSLLAPALVTRTASAQTSGRPDGMRFVPNVPEQVFNLTQYADPLGLDITTTPDPSACRHYQGMARVNGPDGTPFFLVTRSGNTPHPPGEIGCDDSPGETRNGHLIVFRLDSRDKNGERLRSNRLARFTHVDQTTPNGSLDRATVYFTVIGGDPNDPDPAKRPGLVLRDGPNNLPPRVYQHPGGMQLVGNILAIALEEPRQFGPQDACTQCALSGDLDSPACKLCLNYERATEPTLIQFYDVSNPEEPIFKSQFVPKNSNGETLSKAGVVGITPLPNGRYLMVITGGSSNHTWFFYRSNVNDLSAPNLTWEQVRSPLAPETADAHQTLNFLREGNINGRLFLAGARGHVEIGPWFEDRERIDLYEINCQTPNCEPGEEITWTTVVNSKRITPRPSSGGEQLASLAAASTFYVSPSGEVILYATEHDNDGPGETMKAGEFRHVDVVRAGSPTLLPSAKLDGPFVVDEGSAIDLTGTGQQPITKAFIQLWHEKDFKPLYLTATYDDRNRDDFDELFIYEPIIFPFLTHADKARSWNWFAPQGCSIQAIDRTQPGADIDEMKTLTGATSVQLDADLELVMHDGGTDNIDREIDRLLFGADCDAYYSAAVNLFWDLNRDGTFETQGTSANFSAAQVDGPANVQIPIEARHSMGGAPGTGFAAVTVRNVAPQLSQFRLLDSGGNQVNSTVPFVLTGLPVKVAADFSDPGVLDHQTAQVSWGDGATETNTAFNSFDEAFGDGVGSVSHIHLFNTPGTYTVELSVSDDDSGQDVESATVRVLTPEQALLEVIGMIDTAIANTTNADVRTSLQRARRALTGTNEHSNDGALQMLREDNPLAAVAFIETSVNWLQEAQNGGAIVAVPITLLKQVAAALEGA